MHNTHIAAMSDHQVSALFADRVLSFNLSNGATFADLAERLSDMYRIAHGHAGGVSLKFGGDGPMVGVYQSGVSNPDLALVSLWLMTTRKGYVHHSSTYPTIFDRQAIQPTEIPMSQRPSCCVRIASVAAFALLAGCAQ